LRPCRSDAYEAIPKQKVTVNLKECERRLSSAGYEIVSNPGVMLVVKKSIEVTLYPHGRLLLFPVKEKEEAERMAREFYELLGM
jgi:hypothetical protein